MSRSLTIGDRVGSYRLVGKLGEGGMGLVFAAEHETIGKRAAVKVLLPQYSQNPEFVRRFFNEARAVTRIRHPGLIDVYDFGQHEATGCAFIVMELLDGESLATRLGRESPLEEKLLIEIASQTAGVLAAVHATSIVHRDLKPDNVFLVPDPSTVMRFRVKVLDFGIAKLADGGGTGAKTKTGALLGTPAYMAPEQCRGLSSIDHRADIYSLGCMMYEMIAATPPFTGEGLGDILAAHIYEEPRPVSDLAPQTSAPLAHVITKSMAKKPDERYASMDDLAADLAAIAGSVGQLAGTVIGSGAAIVTSAQSKLASPVSRPRTTLSGAAAELTGPGDPRRPRRVRRVSAVAAAVLSAAALAYVSFRKDNGQRIPIVAAAIEPKATTPSNTVESKVKMPVEAKAPPVAPKIHVAIDSSPKGAEIFRRSDGIRLGSTPWSSEVERGTGSVAYVLRAPGFHHENVEFDTQQDHQVTVRMRPERHAPARTNHGKQPEFDAP